MSSTQNKWSLQALLRGEFGEDDTILVSAPGGAKAEALVLSQGGSKSAVGQRGRYIGPKNVLGPPSDGSDATYDVDY